MNDIKNYFHIAMGIHNQNNYFIHSLVALESFCSQCSIPVSAHIFFDNTLNSKQIELFEIIINNHNGEINFIDLSTYLAEIPLLPAFKNFSIGCLFRLFIPEFYQKENILYIDSDVFATGDPSKIYSSNTINQYMISAVKDVSCHIHPMNQYIIDIGCDPNTYFNSGVLYFNCSNVHSLVPDFTNKAIKLLVSHPKFMFPDQDVLNSLLKDKINFLSSKANYQISYGKRVMMPIEQLQDKVLHYSGIKPWEYIYPAGMIYWQNRKALLNHISLTNM